MSSNKIHATIKTIINGIILILIYGNNLNDDNINKIYNYIESLVSRDKKIIVLGD